MSLLDLRQAIVDDLQANIPDLKECAGHAGRFDREEIRRIAHKSPAVFVACLAASETEDEGGEIESDLRWGAFIVAKDQRAVKRDEVALALLQALLLHLPGNRWNVEAGRPENIAAQNLYSGKIDKLGIAMWGVSWSQRMTLGAALDETTLAVFATLHTEHSLVPGVDEPAAIDDVILEQG